MTAGCVSKHIEIHTSITSQLIREKVWLTSELYLGISLAFFLLSVNFKSGRKAQIYHPGWYFPRAPRVICEVLA